MMMKRNRRRNVQKKVAGLIFPSPRDAIFSSSSLSVDLGQGAGNIFKASSRPLLYSHDSLCLQ